MESLGEVDFFETMRSLDIVTWNGGHLHFILECYDRQQGAGNLSAGGIHNNVAMHFINFQTCDKSSTFCGDPKKLDFYRSSSSCFDFFL